MFTGKKQNMILPCIRKQFYKSVAFIFVLEYLTSKCD